MLKKLFITLTTVIILMSCGNNDNTERLIVASSMVHCIGVSPQACFLVKESQGDDWELWYSGIEGFDYIPGFEYVLKVRKEYREAPVPADASTFRYVLVEVVSSTMKESDNLPPGIYVEF